MPHCFSRLSSIVLLSLVVGACAVAPPTESPGSPRTDRTAAPSFLATTSLTPTPSASTIRLGVNGRIVFNRHDTTADTSSAFTIAADGSTEHRIGTGNVSCGGWSSDGNTVACTAWFKEGARPTTADSNGSHFRLLDVRPARKWTLVCGSWVPNRATFLCGTDPGGTPGDDDGLYLVRASDSDNLQRVTVTPADCFDTNALASPDGGEVLFVRFCGSEEHGVLFRVRTDGSDLAELSPTGVSVVDAMGGMSADWSPDGSKVVFCTQPMPNPRDEPYTMFVENVDGSELHQIVSSDVGAVSAQWSPDGRSIAFTSKLRSEPQVWTVQPDGSGLVMLTDGSGGSTSLAPVWSPDGEKILFTNASKERVSLWTMDADGGRRSHLTDISNVESIGYAWGRASAR
jgi:hypothetical protein